MFSHVGRIIDKDTTNIDTYTQPQDDQHSFIISYLTYIEGNVLIV